MNNIDYSSLNGVFKEAYEYKNYYKNLNRRTIKRFYNKHVWGKLPLKLNDFIDLVYEINGGDLSTKQIMYKALKDYEYKHHFENIIND